MNEVFDVYVKGTPIQQGSMKAFPIRRSNGSLGVSMIHNKAGPLTAWREQIRVEFIKKYPELSKALTEGGYFKQYSPIHVTAIFYLKKPKSSKLPDPTNKKADLDKLLRAIHDAMSGLVYFDDCQIIEIDTTKEWADDDTPEGVHIIVYDL